MSLADFHWIRKVITGRADAVAKAQARVDMLTEASEVVRLSALESANRLTEVERLVRIIVQEVHGPEFDFRVKSGEAPNGDPTLDLLVTENGVELPVSRHGGAVTHTIDVAFRLAITLLHPNTAPFLICDEPVTTYDDQNRMEALARIIQGVGEEFGLTAIFVSHDAVPIGNTIRVEKPNYWAKVSQVS